jgi:hypothetical protein
MEVFMATIAEIDKRISEAERFIESHPGVTSWDQLSEDDLLDWDSRIRSGLDFSYRKGYQYDPVLVALKVRHDAVIEWNESLGGYDE